MTTYKSGVAWINAIEKKLKDVDDVVATELLGTLELFTSRVFDSGKNANGVVYGKSYSPSYKKYRLKRGRRVDRVNLQLEGDMRKDIGSGIKKKGQKTGFGFDNNFNTKKWEWNEERYGNLSQLTKFETQGLMKRIDKSVTELLNNA